MSSILKGYYSNKATVGQGNPVTVTAFSGDKIGLDVNVLGGTVTGTFSGTFTQSGLKVAMRTTTMDVTDVATVIPAVALAGRNAISIVNLDTLQTLYIGNSNVVAGTGIGTTAGWEVGPQEGFNVDVTDTIPIYGIAPAGQTIRVKVLELA